MSADDAKPARMTLLEKIRAETPEQRAEREAKGAAERAAMEIESLVDESNALADEEEFAREEHAAAQQREAEATQQREAEAARQLDPARFDIATLKVAVEGGCVAPTDESIIDRWGATSSANRVSEQRVRMHCPSCSNEDVLIVELWHDRARVRARCAAGCSDAQIASELAEELYSQERAMERAARERAEADQLAEMKRNVSLRRLYENVAPLEWIIHRLVVRDALTILGGDVGGGKTFFAMMTAIVVAMGLELFGHNATRGKVLIVLLEGAKSDWARRIEALARGMGINLDDLFETLSVYDEPLVINDPESYARLAEYVRRLGYVYVVIDNLSEIRDGAGQNSENDATAMAAAMRPLVHLAHEHRVGVLLLHHTNAAGALRGSTAILQMADEELLLSKRVPSSGIGNNSVYTITRSPKKNRSGKGLECPLVYRLDDDFELDDRGRRKLDEQGDPILRAIAPVLCGEAADDDAQEHGGAHDERARGAAGEADRALMLRLCAGTGLTATELSKAMPGRNTKVIALREQLVSEGALVLRGNRYCTTRTE